MRRQLSYGLIFSAAVTLAGCRQADGPMPTPNANAQSEIGDISRDLLNITRGYDPQSPQDLAQDLRKYTDRQTVLPAIDELSRRTAQVVAGSKLTEQSARQLAHNLWVVVVGRELSERQVDSLQGDIQGLLVNNAGVPQERAESVVAQVDEVQRLVTSRPRRWYELF